MATPSEHPDIFYCRRLYNNIRLFRLATSGYPLRLPVVNADPFVRVQ